MEVGGEEKKKGGVFLATGALSKAGIVKLFVGQIRGAKRPKTKEWAGKFRRDFRDSSQKPPQKNFSPFLAWGGG